jgi:hypothetical protein
MVAIVAGVRSVSSMTGELPAPIEPDTKDWTWTLERPCPECGFEASTVAAGDIASQTLTLTSPWAEVLARPDATQRPAPSVWSPLEYGCHVRDVCRVFEGRVRQMLAEDGARFANWDQDATALEQGYAAQSPALVGAELQESAQQIAGTFGQVQGEEWSRRGLRSDGSEFTVLTLGQYFLHDLAHHLVDVRA